MDRNYLGDYCNLHHRPDLQRKIPRNEKIDFSSYFYKYDRRFRRQGRYLIITNQAVYIIEEQYVRLKKTKLGFHLSKFSIHASFQVKVPSGGKNPGQSSSRNKQNEGYTLDYIVKRRILLENICEIKMRFDRSEMKSNRFDKN